MLKVGAATEVELKEKKHRIEDALSAARAGVEEGMVAGGGSVLIHAIPALDKLEVLGDEAIGVNILRRALEEPLRQIAINAGQEGSVVVEAVRKLPAGHGYDAARGEYGDLFAGHHRPGQGHPLGARERRQRGRPAPDHRDGHHRPPGEGEGDAGHAARRRDGLLEGPIGGPLAFARVGATNKARGGFPFGGARLSCCPDIRSGKEEAGRSARPLSAC